WHLHTDEQGKLWELRLPADLQQHPRGTAPGLTAMRRGDVSAGFSAEVEQGLRAHPGLVVEIARGLLQDTFPDTLHEDIAQAVGLDLTETAHTARDGEEAFSYGQRRQRNKAFRDRVLRAYEYRCCVCGFD
ncbi:hypothetical protein RZS08_42885, partial [Arthrospira platensis SPKY1]|nr:hypothetical protein [Arthrospira platensis SPKY1]